MREPLTFACFLQEQAPMGWTIREVAPDRYQITTDDDLTATVDRSGISEGWQVKLRDTGISTEFTVTTPDGRALWFHDCWNA